MTQQKSVIDWLKDAHAMEVGGVTTLSDHAAAARDYPKVRAKLEAHAQATRRHAELIQGRLEGLGEGPSSLKEAVGAAFSKVAGVANLPASDTVVKNALGDFAAENFEIASYRSLIAAAEVVGDQETVRVCEQILQDEEEMAGWLKEEIPALTREFMGQPTDTEGGVLDRAKQTVQNLTDQAKAAVPDAADTRNALLVSGALLAGAGAALLVGKALRGGAEGRHDEAGEPVDTATGADTPAPAYADMAAGVGVDASESQPVLPTETVSDLPVELIELAEPVAPTETPADLTDLTDLTDLSALSTLDEADAALSQDDLITETVGGDAALLVASGSQSEVMAEAPQAPEPVTAPELRDGSQDPAETPKDDERR